VLGELVEAGGRLAIPHPAGLAEALPADATPVPSGHGPSGSLRVAAMFNVRRATPGGYASSSVRRVLSTWRGFGRFLVASGRLPANPLDTVEGPRRPDCFPKAEYAELERIAGAAGTADPRARDPRRGGTALSSPSSPARGCASPKPSPMPVGAVEAAECSPACGCSARRQDEGRPRGARGDRGDRRLPRHSPGARQAPRPSTDPLFVRRLRRATVSMGTRPRGVAKASAAGAATAWRAARWARPRRMTRSI
jgi:hypothetical protein